MKWTDRLYNTDKPKRFLIIKYNLFSKLKIIKRILSNKPTISQITKNKSMIPLKFKAPCGLYSGSDRFLFNKIIKVKENVTIRKILKITS